jgi:hypothetical protein
MEQKNWAQPEAVPKWTKRFRLYGDLRARYEWDLFDPRNSNFFVNFAQLDAGAPFDLNNAAGTPPPILNTTKNRQRMLLRARLGLDAVITDDFSAGIRLATGNTTNPVSTNQTLGTTLNKDNFLLDRAYLDYHPLSWAKVQVGRFPNPWFYSDLVWDDDIAFDGVAAEFNGAVNDEFSLFGTAGAFPIENTPFNFPDNSIFKGDSRDKWLFGAQIGEEWHATDRVTLKVGAAYYDYDNLEGSLSQPCIANSGADPCSTDNSRPGFLQKGNTLFAIRDLVSTAVNPPQFQYYGLASPFHDVDLRGRVDYAMFGPVHVMFDGDVVKNLAFDTAKISAKNPVNNSGASGKFDGGNLGYMAGLTVGYPVVENLWDWNVGVAYKYLASDAVPDAFTDSDFHLGGTNAKGYVVGATLGVAPNVNILARWLSSTEVTSLPLTVDVVQVDVNARF